MRAFTSIRGIRTEEARTRDGCASRNPLERERTAPRRSADEEPLITPEDGDLWQPVPDIDAGRTFAPHPVFVDVTASAEAQAEARWTLFLKESGFEPIHHHVPEGFDGFDWTPVFPIDREEVARLLEPVVAMGQDIQEAIDRFGRSRP